MKIQRQEARQKLLAALFAKAHKAGIHSEFVRDEIAKNIIGKRLSAASPQEIVRVLEHIAGLQCGSPPPAPSRGGQQYKYASSKKGLIEELEDAARERWGEGFQTPLNAFVNHNRKNPTHYRFLDVTTMKALKERIREMNNEMA